MTCFKHIQFCMLNICVFWVPWVTLWYPKIIVLTSMMSRLSNAVSDTFFGFLTAFLQCYEVWSFLRIFEEKFPFWNVSWNWINHECFKFCTFWSRIAMKMIDTALESLDVLFVDDKILGTTGVRYHVIL